MQPLIEPVAPVVVEPVDPDRLLIRGLGLRNLTANIFNYTVGSGIFVLPGIVAAALGPPALLAYLLCCFIIGLVVLVFAEAGSRVSITGGPYAYVEVGLGSFWGLIAGMLLCLTDVAALAAIAMLLAGMIAALLQLPGTAWQSVVAVVLLGTLAVINIRGVKGGARLIEACTALKLLPLLFFIAVGAFFVSPANLRWQHMPAASEVANTAGILIFAFAGIEAALLPSGEVRNPARTVPRAAMLALGLVTLLYLLVQGVALGVLGSALGNERTAPLAGAAATFAGSTGRSILLVGAAVSMFGWITGSVLAGPRAFFALARDGFLPRPLARVHGRFHTPHVAILTYAALSAALALSGTFEQLAILSNIAASGVYFMCAISVLVLRRRNVRGEAEPFRPPGGVLVPLLACASIVWVVVETITKREFMALAIVFVIAVPGYMAARGMRGS